MYGDEFRSSADCAGENNNNSLNSASTLHQLSHKPFFVLCS
jgi:hypothetical protein